MFLLGRCQQIQFYNFFRSVPLQIDVYYEITLKRGFKCKNSLFCLFDSVDSDDSDDSIESVDPLRSCTTSCLTLLNGHHISGHWSWSALAIFKFYIVAVPDHDCQLCNWLRTTYMTLVKVHYYIKIVLCNFYVIWSGFTDFHIRKNKAKKLSTFTNKEITPNMLLIKQRTILIEIFGRTWFNSIGSRVSRLTTSIDYLLSIFTHRLQLWFLGL